MLSIIQPSSVRRLARRVHRLALFSAGSADHTRAKARFQRAFLNSDRMTAEALHKPVKTG